MIEEIEEIEELLDEEEEATSELYEHHRIEADSGQNNIACRKISYDTTSQCFAH